MRFSRSFNYQGPVPPSDPWWPWYEAGAQTCWEWYPEECVAGGW